MVFSRLVASMRKVALGLLVGTAALGAAHAAVVNVSASQASVQVGGSFSLYFDISGLSPSSLGGFDLDLKFDDTVLAFSGYSFDDNTTGVNQLDLIEAVSLGFLGDALVNPAGDLDAYGYSGNTVAKLDTDQAETFRFLTLHFTALTLASGTTLGVDLNDTNLLFIDAGAADLTYTFGNSDATVVVTGTTGGGTVPEPGALSLAMLALAGAALARQGRRSGHKTQRLAVPAH